MRKNNLAFFTLFVVGLFSLLALNILAQESATARTAQSQKVNLEDKVLQNYIDISSLSKDERKEFFSNLSAEEKANLFKLHLALQFIKRSNLTKEQKDLILEAISMITPDSYNRDNPEKREKSQQDGRLLGQKANTLFSKQESFEIFADLGGGETEINLLRKYLDISALSEFERTQSLQRVSANDKSNLWRVHSAIHLAKLPGLNSRQMEIVLEFITFLTPELYEIPKDTSEWRVRVDEPIKLFTSRALEVFSRDEFVKIFTKLGGKQTSSKDSIAAEGGMVPDGLCNCNRVYDDCQGLTFCTGMCEVPPGGGQCGAGGLFICNGKCR